MEGRLSEVARWADIDRNAKGDANDPKALIGPLITTRWTKPFFTPLEKLLKQMHPTLQANQRPKRRVECVLWFLALSYSQSAPSCFTSSSRHRLLQRETPRRQRSLNVLPLHSSRRRVDSYRRPSAWLAFSIATFFGGIVMNRQKAGTDLMIPSDEQLNAVSGGVRASDALQLKINALEQAINASIPDGLPSRSLEGIRKFLDTWSQINPKLWAPCHDRADEVIEERTMSVLVGESGLPACAPGLLSLIHLWHLIRLRRLRMIVSTLTAARAPAIFFRR
jgi:hypothetical protein